MPYFVKYMDERGEWRWVYYASNHEPIAVSSEGYVREDTCDRSIQIVKQYSAMAEVRRRARS